MRSSVEKHACHRPASKGCSMPGSLAARLRLQHRSQVERTCVHAVAGPDQLPLDVFTPGQEGSARRALFNRISRSYDEVRTCCFCVVHVCVDYVDTTSSPSLLLQLNNQLSFGQHWVWKHMAVKWSGAKSGQRVLDVCCGSGDLSFLLARAVGPQGEVSKHVRHHSRTAHSGSLTKL
jgi:hypothetical protein